MQDRVPRLTAGSSLLESGEEMGYRFLDVRYEVVLLLRQAGNMAAQDLTPETPETSTESAESAFTLKQYSTPPTEF
jgi:hypothetical protein